MPEQEIIKIEQKHAMVPRRQVTIRPENIKNIKSYYALIQTPTQM